MSEGSPESAGAAEAQAEDGAGAGTDPEDAEAGRLLADMAEQDPAALSAELTKWKGLARKHEGRAKDNAAAAKELAELKAAGMSDLERTQAELAAAVRERDEARADHSRIMAAATHNVPVELIDHLGSGTDEEINDRAELFAQVIDARARELAEEIVAQQNGSRNGSAPAARPVESLRPGSSPSSGATPRTTEDWFRRLVQGRE